MFPFFSISGGRLLIRDVQPISNTSVSSSINNGNSHVTSDNSNSMVGNFDHVHAGEVYFFIK